MSLAVRGWAKWCYVRHRALEPVGDQQTIVHRLVDPSRVLDPVLQPPTWTTLKDTLWFQLTVPNARIPGESQYIGLSASNVVSVLVNDVVHMALPEFCLVLPSGEVLDLEQYGGNIPLPAEVSQDESACITASTGGVVTPAPPPPVGAVRGAGGEATALVPAVA